MKTTRVMKRLSLGFMAGCLLLAGAVRAQTLTDGLVGYWPMDNTRGTSLTDHTATANDGAFTGGTPAWVAGKFGNAMDIYGVRLDRAAIPHHASYNANNAYSISFWMYPINGYRLQNIFTKGDNKVELGSSNQNAMWTYFGTGWVNTDIGFTLNSAVWKHIVIIYDPAATPAKQVYVNGSLKASSTTVGTPDPALNTDPIAFSSASNLSSARYDDVAIWNRGLTTDEIAYLYNGGTGNIVSDMNALPSAPTGVSATASDTRVVLSWSLNTVDPDPASYRVYRHTSSGGPYTLVASNLTVGRHVDTGLVNGTPYYYVIRTVDVRGAESADSAEVTATPVEDLTPPGAPTGLAAQAGYTRVYLSWTANAEPDLAGYNVYDSAAAGGPFVLTQALVTATSWVGNGLPNDTLRYYRITAVDVAGNESGVSATVSATPLAYHDTNPGLVGYWPLDQSSGTSLLDVTASANHGSLAGAPQWVSGKLGNALSFNLTTLDRATIPGLAAYRANKVFTIAFWMNQVEGYRKKSFYFSGIEVYDFYLNPFGSPWTSTYFGFKNDQIWHHIALVFDPYAPGGDGKRFYVDGTLRASNIAYDTDSSVLGGSGMSFSGTGYSWSGKIDDVACWDQALTVDQIQSLWNGGTGRPAYTSPPKGTLISFR